MQTRKHPRTLNEAFGPYTSKHFIDDPMPKADKIVIAVCCVGVLALIGMALAGWL